MDVRAPRRTGRASTVPTVSRGKPEETWIDVQRSNEELRAKVLLQEKEIARLRARLEGVQRRASMGDDSQGLGTHDEPGTPMDTHAHTHTHTDTHTPHTHAHTTTHTQFGDFPAINSTNIALFSAAHHSRTISAATQFLPPPPEPSHLTDTASIRRRYLALERGPGNKQELLINPEKLFQSTVVLEFDEDSPSFRSKLEAIDRNVEGMRRHLSRLVSIIARYIECGMAFSAAGREFASELMHLEGESWFTRLGDLAPALVRCGEVIDQVQSLRDVALESLESTFISPMNEFVKRELKEIRDQKDEVSRAYDEYLQQLQRFLQLKRASDEATVQQRTQELISVRRRYELARYDLVNNLNGLETRKKFQLVEKVVCSLYLELGFFHQGHSELANIEPSLREVQHQLRLARRDFAKDSRVAEAKRMQLEVHLSSALKGISAQMALDDWEGMFTSPPAHTDTHTHIPNGLPGSPVERSETPNGPLQSSNDVRRSSTESTVDVDDVTPRSLVSTGRRMSDPLISSGCGYHPVKQGYLWKRSNNMRRDWKRRFFSIRGGKLLYQGEDDPIGPPRGEICDLLISTVRECTRDTDLRFTFEILSPGQRSYMLQAENEEECRDWIRALRSQTETLLVSGHNTPAHSHTDAHTHGCVGVGVLERGVSSLVNVELVENMRKINPICADCGCANPDWAVINMGICVCIQCSGIHRSLGVHVSKVRSLTLDKWSRSLRMLMESVGNARFNAIWEAHISTTHNAPAHVSTNQTAPVSVSTNRAASGPFSTNQIPTPTSNAVFSANKPSPTSTREEREVFIREKYVHKAFLNRQLSDDVTGVCGGGSEGVNEVVLRCAREGDVLGVLWALACGGDANYADEQGNTPLHAVCGEGGSLACVEVLVMYGGVLDALNEREQTPLDLAMANRNSHSQALIAYILNKLDKSPSHIRAPMTPPATAAT